MTVCALLLAAVAHAQTTRSVCANCTYNNTQLQTAINDAAAATGPQVILTEEGRTYTGAFTLPVKADASATNTITIRTGVDANGVVQPLTRYPATDIGVCPSTFNVDWLNCALQPGSQDMTRYSKFVPLGNNSYGFKTVNTGDGTPVSYYTFMFTEHVANSYGGNALIAVLNETASMNADPNVVLPHHITFDRVVVRGDPLEGQFRGWILNGNHLTVKNSFSYDIKSRSEGQNIASWSGVDTMTIHNNYLSGGAEVFIMGGSGTRPGPTFTIQASPAPTATSFTLNATTDLWVGKPMAVHVMPRDIVSVSATSPAVVTTSTPHGYTVNHEVEFSSALTGCTSNSTNIALNKGAHRIRSIIDSTSFSINVDCYNSASGGVSWLRYSTDVATINGNAVTVSPALPVVPVAGDFAETSQILRNLSVRHNVFTRPLAWRTDGLVPTPTGSAVTTSTTGGTLAAGTYAYRVMARMLVAPGDWLATSLPASEVSVTTTGSTSTNTITWNAVTGASSYVVYGRTPGGQNIYWTVNAPTTTFTDTGGSGTSGTPPSSASKWFVKNTFELKWARDALIENNIIENSWTDGQVGPCVVFTGTQQWAEADSAVIRGVIFRYNLIRRCGQFLQITGTDALNQESGRSGGINLNNNLWLEGGSPYATSILFSISGGGGGRRQENRAPFDITLDRNTALTGGSANQLIFVDYCHGTTESTSENTFIQNNIFYSATYGAVSNAPGTTACTGMNIARMGRPPFGANSFFRHNAIAYPSSTGCSGYNNDTAGGESNNTCPTQASIEADTFVGPNNGTIANYAVKNTSPYFAGGANDATDDTTVGADIATLDANIALTISRNLSGTVAAVEILTTTIPSGQVNQAYSQALSITGGVPPYTCALTGGTHPTGITLSGCTIQGTPTQSGTFVLTYTATDSATPTAGTDSQELSLTIDPAPAPPELTITTTSPLPTAIVGEPYSFTLQASGGTPPYTWTRTSGTMISGLAFDGTTGTLSGTPTIATTTPRTYSFLVTDNVGATFEKALTLSSMRKLVRAARYNFTWGAFYVGPDPPTDADQARIGDVWFDTSELKPKWATSLGPPIVWSAVSGANITAGTNLTVTQSGNTTTVGLADEITLSRANTNITGVTNYLAFTRTTDPGAPNSTTYGRIFLDAADNTFKAWQNGTLVTLGGGGGGGGSSAINITFLTVPTGISDTDLPATTREFPFGAARARQFTNLTGMTQCLMHVGVSSLSAGFTTLEMKLQYYDTTLNAWTDTGVSIALSGTGNREGTYGTLAAAARRDLVALRAATVNGDGAVDLGVFWIHATCKP